MNSRKSTSSSPSWLIVATGQRSLLQLHISCILNFVGVDVFFSLKWLDPSILYAVLSLAWSSGQVGIAGKRSDRLPSLRERDRSAFRESSGGPCGGGPLPAGGYCAPVAEGQVCPEAAAHMGPGGG